MAPERILVPRSYPVLSVLEVHDGDTFRLMVDCGFEHAAFPWLRLRGYSCPELSQPRGREARDATAELLAGGVERIATLKRPGFEDAEKSFARYVADVWLSSGVLLGEVLVHRELAVRGARVG
jgi:endonuclease YncB( thermonuclease family)